MKRAFAPYGHNQIWRFALVTDAGLIKDLAALTTYKKFVAVARLKIRIRCEPKRKKDL